VPFSAALEVELEVLEGLVLEGLVLEVLLVLEVPPRAERYVFFILSLLFHDILTD
jgi:hypothetical protein